MVTNEFSISPMRIGRQGVELWLAKWWWAAAIPLAAMLAAAVCDWRWLIAAAAMALIAIPAILAYAYYDYALDPRMAQNIRPHSVAIDESQITITYYHYKESGDDQDAESLPGEKELLKTETAAIPRSEIEKIVDAGSSIIIRMRNSPRYWIEIPKSAILQ